eukprot:m.333065 g.333065  ORF g.333065 m.333065 type:complete len:259 (-) comp17059_c0_seq1:991-1767(-)
MLSRTSSNMIRGVSRFTGTKQATQASIAVQRKWMSTDDKPFHSLIMGPPGGGKGTISKRILKRFDIPCMSTGDMIRSQIQAKTPMGVKFQQTVNEGKLVPADLVFGLVSAELDNTTGPFMLDGFPRSVEQAEMFSGHTYVDCVLNIDVPFETVIERLSSRWCHLPSGRIYNLEYNPPKVAGKDDETGEDLVQREDDKPETIRHRLELYREETMPVLEFYDKQGLVVNFPGTESDVIFPEVAKYLEGEKGLPVTNDVWK